MNLRKSIILWAVFLGSLLMAVGCGGGGKSSGGGTLPQASAPPTVALGGWVPNDAQLLQFKAYTFSATGNDPNIGGAITEFQWDFGDGTKVVTPAVLTGGKATASCVHAYATSGAPKLSVVAKNAGGLLSSPATNPLTVTPSSSPLTATFTTPAGPISINPPLGGTSPLTFLIHVTNTGTGTINASGILLDPGDPAATQSTPVDMGNGDWSITVSYLAASAVGSRTATPTITVVDSDNTSSAATMGPLVTVKTVVLATAPPTIVITTPATPTVTALTSKSVALEFTLTDQYDNPVSYTVDWGVAGLPASCQPKTVSGITTAGTLAGVKVSLTHIYPDTFVGNATVTVTATDSASSNPDAVPQTRTIQVALNQLPTAAITSPQASSMLPDLALIQDGGQGKPVIPAGSSNPDVVVIPSNGKLVFNGTGSAPTSGGTLTYGWTFPGGVPNSSSQQNPGEVIFPGVSGKIVAYLVNLNVTDATDAQDAACKSVGRTSATNAKTTQKWVVVDGVNTQNFNLSFSYRQTTDSTGSQTLAPVATTFHGLGSVIQIFQDGVTYSYRVQDALMLQALISVPVRSDQPFWLDLPPGISSDTRAYFMRIPNAPTGAYADPTLVNGTPLATWAFPFLANMANPSAQVSTFGFQYPSATTGPWNPTLNIVTAQGFASETSQATQRRLQGTLAYIGGDRWLARPSVPFDDPTGSVPLEYKAAEATFSGVLAYQTFAEWLLALQAVPTAETSVAGTSANLGFNLNYSAYSADSKTSDSFKVDSMQAFRAPGASGDPFDLDAAGWGAANCTAPLSPTAVNSAVPAFFNQAIYGTQGNTAFAGGLTGLAIPYDPNDAYRKVKAPSARGFNPVRSVFSYSEYLWSRVWDWPVVLNAAQLNWTASYTGLSSFPGFRYTATSAWPKQYGISPKNSAFDLTASGGGVFNASFPAAENGGAPSSTGVGRFFWTAFTPWYNGAPGCLIARTWLADGGTLQPPTAISGSSSGDATAALGFVPPQDVMVDKQGRNADGSLNGQSLGGYRVAWFNATKDASGNPVPPDFWVVELVANGQVQHFMVPGSFPAKTIPSDPASGYPTFPTTTTPNPDAIPILTDARVQMTSAQVYQDVSTLIYYMKNMATGQYFVPPPAGATLQPVSIVAPGYCWFDVPLELRPTAGSSATLRVYALKAISANNPGGKLTPRALNRTEWIEAIKTATANISVRASDGTDLSYVYKIPFNYCWDIVVTNGPATPVAP